MKFTVTERALLLDMLKTVSGGIFTLRIITDLLNELGFTEAELKSLDIKETGEKIQWVEIPEIEVEIGEKAHEIIQQTLQAASDGERLTLEHMSLWERFVPKDDDQIEAAD